MKALKKYLLWNSQRSLSRNIASHQRTEPTVSNELLQTIIEWNKNGSLFTHFQYNHLQSLFEHDNGSEFFNIFTNTFNYNASKLLSYAKYAPQTREGNQLLLKLMHEFANIGDYSSCSVLFKWISIQSIDYYNIILCAIYNHTLSHDSDNNAIIESWDIWCNIKQSPIAFDEHSIFYLINILKCNKNHLKQFIDELLTHYDSIISRDTNIIAHILPFIDDVNIALQKYQKHVDLDPNKLSIAMLANCINNIHKFNNDHQLINSYILSIIQHCSIDIITKRSIANTLSNILVLPIKKKEKYKFDNTNNIISIFKNEHNNGYINYLLDDTSSMQDIGTICKQYNDAFDVDNVYNMIYRMIHDLKLSKQMDHSFISFVMNKVKQLIPVMTFNDARIALKLLSILNKEIILYKGDFIALIELIQKQMIHLFITNKELILGANTSVNHKCIVYNIDEVIGIMAAFSKHRTYSQDLMSFLSEQIVVNIQKRNPQYASSITYFNTDTQQRNIDKDILILYPIYTSLLRYLRYLNFYQNKVYELISSTLQKRPNIIKIQELREWSLAFGTMQHKSNSIWLSIQCVLLHHYPNSECVIKYMALDMLIDFVWSMSVLDLIPNYWLMADLIHVLNDTNNRQNIDNLAFIHKTRLWEIFQSLYANQTCYQSLNLVNKDIVESLHTFYDEFVVTQFYQQCRLRPSLHKFCKFLNDKQIHYEIGESIGNMCALCDIIIPQYKICIEVFDYAHITKRSQNRTREWVKSKARREITRRLIQNTQSKWHFVLVNGVDPQYDMLAFSKLIHRFVFVERIKDQSNDIDANNMNTRRFGLDLNLAS